MLKIFNNMTKKLLIFLFLIFTEFSYAQKVKPNILFILVDDYGYFDLSATGSKFYETPNIDRLFKESMRFNQAYATYPRCVPSRYSIMTGTHSARKGQDDSGVVGFHLEGQTTSIGQAMKQAGYHTFYLGKWHLGGNEYGPNNKGFDEIFAAGAAGGVSSHFAPYNRDFQNLGGVPEAETAPIDNVENAPEGECLEDRLTDESIRMIQGFSKKKQPFFGILAHYAVHTPIEGKQSYIQYFKDKLTKLQLEGPAFEKESAGENKLIQDHATYAALIKAVDDGVGKILSELDRLKLTDNTIIVLTSDHGGLSARGPNKRELATSNRPYRAGKGHLYEGGLRVPMIVKWKGVVKPNSSSEALIQGTDHFLTFLEIAGGALPKHQPLDGKSYFSILKGAKPDSQRAIYWHNPAPRPYATGDVYSSAIRVGDFKLLDLFGDEKRIELYNLKQDPSESKNIVNESPEKAQEMLKKLDEWRVSVGAFMKLTPRGLGKGPNQGKRNNN